ncbi:MAG: thioredoxin family protein [Bacteroidia bacterium]
MLKPEIVKSITRLYGYEEYKSFVISLANEHKSTGEQTNEHVAATLINSQRIKRIDKQCELNSELKNSLDLIKSRYQWIVITESWCGDGAQCLPVIAKMAKYNSLINLKIILRDQNLEMMDLFLTNGNRAIPKLICLDENSNKIIGTWGPRPKIIQDMVVDYKNKFPEATHEEFVTSLHLWYARDKTQAIQTEFVELLKKWSIQKTV